MAENQSLFDELGIGRLNEDTLFQSVQEREREAAKNPSQAQLGQGAGEGLAQLIGGVRSLFGKNKDQTFAEGMEAGRLRRQDGILQSATGIPRSELERRRRLRKKINALKSPSTGDAFKDTDSILQEIIKLASQEGDQDLVIKTQAKRLALKKEHLELRTAEAGAKQAEAEADESERLEDESDSVGRPVILQGDDINKAHSVATLNDDGTWTVVRPDGSVEEKVDGGRITFVDPSIRESRRLRQFETFDAQMKNALAVNSMSAGRLQKTRDSVKDMGQQAGIITDMTNSLLNMYDPDLAFDLSGKTLVGVDKLATFAGNVSEVFARRGDRTNKNWDITWQGKAVTAAMQAKLGTDVSILDAYAAENGISLTEILPPHIKADSREAQLFMANVMQMAYLDARLQEPSNRGLSDNDIKAALTRLGVNTADPTVFARRQQQIIQRLRGRIENLGVEFSGTSQIDKDQIRKFVYQPDLTNGVLGKLDEASGRLETFLSGGGQQTLSQMSNEDLDRAIEAAKAKQ